ncbi:unnamed protein product [Effrenium voratum]|nr:unnamed protein product [Effrenium voratum]
MAARAQSLQGPSSFDACGGPLQLHHRAGDSEHELAPGGHVVFREHAFGARFEGRPNANQGAGLRLFSAVVRRDVAPLCTLGVIVSNLLTKGLKLLVRQTLPDSVWRRPDLSSRDVRDPGFPSSHTSNMTFISVYFALYLWLHLGYPPGNSALVATVPSMTMAFARIQDKDHTLPQTLAGLVWGACLGMWWALIGPRLRGILEWAHPQPWALVVLCFFVGLPMFTKPLGIRVPRPEFVRWRRAR